MACLHNSCMRLIDRSYQRRGRLSFAYASDEERMYAIERAEAVESGLNSRYPSFVKPMLQSHVSGGFWLVFPHPTQISSFIVFVLTC